MIDVMRKWPPRDILEILYLRFCADKISARRRELDIHRNELAARAGVSRPTIDRWEQGFLHITGPNMISLCIALDVGSGDLMPKHREMKKLQKLAETIKAQAPRDPEKMSDAQWGEFVDQFEELESYEARKLRERHEARAEREAS